MSNDILCEKSGKCPYMDERTNGSQKLFQCSGKLTLDAEGDYVASSGSGFYSNCTMSESLNLQKQNLEKMAEATQ